MMKNNKLKLYLTVIVSVILTWLIFEVFFYVTSLGYVSIGDSYCKFGPIPAKYASFNVTFKSEYTGQLTLIDKSGKQLPNADYTVIVNGKTVGTSFKAPGKRLVNIKIRGNSNKVAGRTFVRVKGGGPFITHYYFRHHSNPFVYYLIAFVITCLFVAVLWFVFLQKQFYPRFRAINKTIIIPNQAPISIRFKGARGIILDNVKHEQNIWDKIVKGPVIYKVIPNLTAPIKLSPTENGRKILFRAPITSYICSPNPIDIQPSIVTDLINNQSFTI